MRLSVAERKMAFLKYFLNKDSEDFKTNTNEKLKKLCSNEGIIISQKRLKDFNEKYLQTGSVKDVFSRQNRIARTYLGTFNKIFQKDL